MKLFILFLTLFPSLIGVQIKTEQELHRANTLNDNQVHYLSQLGDISNLEEILDRILIPRVVSSKNHAQVRNYIVQFMKNLGWTVELDEFEDRTPIFGVLTFNNIITTLNPHAKRFLILACHYDSKYTREGDFVGATDSAVPCAMMLNLAYQMKDVLKNGRSDLSLKFIFFDGEEAFKSWGPKDSIYGARHLAPQMANSIRDINGKRVSQLEQIDIMVLLDLLGAPDPRFYNYFSNTEKWYALLSNIEDRLADMSQFRQYSKGRTQQVYFAKVSLKANIEDDHIPFMARGVPILHIIPSPFPFFWHTSGDNKAAVDMHTVENLNKIFRVFVAQYLHLQVPEEFENRGRRRMFSRRSIYRYNPRRLLRFNTWMLS